MVSLGKRTGILIVTVLLMLLTIPVDAAYVHAAKETSAQVLQATSSGDTYVYMGTQGLSLPATQYLTQSQDVSITRYSYSLSSWSVSTASYNGPATREYGFASYETDSYGWLSGGTVVPYFLKMANTTAELPELSISQERLVVPLTVGTQNSIIVEPYKWCFGTFSIGSEEFVHVTLGSGQDGIEAYAVIAGPNCQMLMETYIAGGDIEVMPFRPAGPGTYTLLLNAWCENAGLLEFEVQIQAVSPEEISFGEAVEGVLPGSELIIDTQDGSMTHREKAPAAHTYKFHSNYTSPGMLQYSMNFPEMDPVTFDPYEPWILMQSDALVNGPLDVRYLEGTGATGDVYHYQSFQNEVYYATVVGMENVEYTLYHALADARYLPVNTPFFIQNDVFAQQQLYMLDLSADSVLRANYSDVLGSGYGWRIWSVFDEMYYRSLQLSPSSSFADATIYYLPAGRYLIEATAAGESSEGYYQFNIGPVIDGEGGFSVPLGGLIGVRFESDPLGWYNVTLGLTTRDNITVEAEYVFFNAYGGVIGGDFGAMGNRQSGVGWQEYGTNTTEILFSRATNNSYIVVTSPHSVVNNTMGLPGVAYDNYVVDYSIAAHECSNEIHNGSATVQLDTAPVQQDFSLGEPAEPVEVYSLVLNCTEGVWLNISVYSEDVDDWTASVHQVIDGYTQVLGWSDLDDTLVGIPPDECYFQFGAISGTVRIDFSVSRSGLGEGILSVTVTPIETNVFQFMPPVEHQSGGAADWIAQNIGIVLVGAGAAVVAVVVVIIVAKRRGK